MLCSTDISFVHLSVAVGYFAHAEYNGFESTLAYIDTPLQRPSGHCLAFWYFMSGHVGTLQANVWRSDSRVPTWERTDNHGTQWQQGEIYIPAEAFPIEKVRVLTVNYQFVQAQ